MFKRSQHLFNVYSKLIQKLFKFCAIVLS